MATHNLTTHAVILAGGRGTRFWPRSRTRTPKQLLNIVGKETMLQQTVARLRPLVPPERIWTVTNSEQAQEVRKQLPSPARRRVLTEPIGRNTAAAIALAAVARASRVAGRCFVGGAASRSLHRESRELPQNRPRSLDMAREPGRMVVLGIPPTRPDTGFGYIERMGKRSGLQGISGLTRFAASPKNLRWHSRRNIRLRRIHWNAGMFFWRVSTFLDNLKKYLPKTDAALETWLPASANVATRKVLRKIYPTLENISVDYAILEPATREQGSPRVFVIPAEVGWSDIGSWTAVYELREMAKKSRSNQIGLPSQGQAIDSQGNFLWSPTKYIAAIGVHDLIVVETPDALLICPRDRAQDVGKIG